MSLIPLKDTVIITKSGGINEYGESLPSVSNEYSCRINEGTKLTRNQKGAEVVTNTQILLGGAVAVSYDDDVTWTDATGVTLTRKPIAIRIIKDISSKPLFTEVQL